MAEYPEMEGRTAEERQWFADLRSIWDDIGDQLTHGDKAMWFSLLEKITANKEKLPSKHLVGGRAKRDGNWFSWLFLRTMFGYDQVHHLKAAEMARRAHPRTSLEFDMLPHGYIRRFNHADKQTARVQASPARRPRHVEPVEEITVAMSSPETAPPTRPMQYNDTTAAPFQYMPTPDTAGPPPAAQQPRARISVVFNGSEVHVDESLTEVNMLALMQRVEKKLDSQHQETLSEMRRIESKGDQQYQEVLRLLGLIQSEQLRAGEDNGVQLGRIYDAVRGLAVCLEGCGTVNNDA